MSTGWTASASGGSKAIHQLLRGFGELDQLQAGPRAHIAGHNARSGLPGQDGYPVPRANGHNDSMRVIRGRKEHLPVAQSPRDRRIKQAIGSTGSTACPFR